MESFYVLWPTDVEAPSWEQLSTDGPERPDYITGSVTEYYEWTLELQPLVEEEILAGCYFRCLRLDHIPVGLDNYAKGYYTQTGVLVADLFGLQFSENVWLNNFIRHPQATTRRLYHLFTRTLGKGNPRDLLHCKPLQQQGSPQDSGRWMCLDAASYSRLFVDISYLKFVVEELYT